MKLRTLVLMRHAQSGHPGGVRDHDRPLTDAGKLAAAEAGDWLRTHADPVDEVLCSTAVRTQQTAAAASVAAPVRLHGELYEAAPQDILDLVRATREQVGTLLVVGHAPGIPAVAAQLISADEQGGEQESDQQGVDQHGFDELQRRFPTAALAVLQFAGAWAELADRSARLTFFRIPA